MNIKITAEDLENFSNFLHFLSKVFFIMTLRHSLFSFALTEKSVYFLYQENIESIFYVY
jgi:hypothetical protein